MLDLVVQVGGATGMIGDPSGRSTERQMMTEEQLQYNIRGISQDIKKFITFKEDEKERSASTSSATSTPSSSPPTSTPISSSSGLLVNNATWFSSFHVIPFFRDVGRHFRMSTMLSKESVSSRLQSENGMSFTEFTYQILQAYDFMHLYKTHGASVQIGGSDQWGNITAGVELIKRDAAATAASTGNVKSSSTSSNTSASTSPSVTRSDSEPQVFGLTLPLLTTASGQKFGKSMGNAPIWLSSAPPPPPVSLSSTFSPSAPSISSPYQFYQYFLSTGDVDVVRFMKLFTDLSVDEIETLARDHAADPKYLTRRLAEEVTRIVHGENGLKEAQSTSAALFSKDGTTALESCTDLAALTSILVGVPQLHLRRDEVVGRSMMDLVIQVGLAKTKSEVKRLVASGGLYCNNIKVEAENRPIEPKDFILQGRACVFRSGKKKQAVIIIKED